MAGRNLRERGSGQDDRDERPERSDPRLPPIARDGTYEPPHSPVCHRIAARASLRATLGEREP